MTLFSSWIESPSVFFGDKVDILFGWISEFVRNSIVGFNLDVALRITIVWLIESYISRIEYLHVILKTHPECTIIDELVLKLLLQIIRPQIRYVRPGTSVVLICPRIAHLCKCNLVTFSISSIFDIQK